uniref:(northern house mosquito) hypothetical protein n=1 Tax=Culex pipiens TaxID=7175 RepID=A0A8D8H8I1_CULPI
MVQEQLVATESVLRELGFQVLKTKMPKAALAIRSKAPSTTQAGGGGQILHRNQVYPPLVRFGGQDCAGCGGDGEVAENVRTKIDEWTDFSKQLKEERAHQHRIEPGFLASPGWVRP